jgi:hypothetical protein
VKKKRSIYCRLNLQHMIQLKTHIVQYFIPYSQYQSTMTEKLPPRNCKTLTNGGGVRMFQQPPSYTGGSRATGMVSHARQVGSEKMDDEVTSQSSRIVGGWV